MLKEKGTRKSIILVEGGCYGHKIFDFSIALVLGLFW